MDMAAPFIVVHVQGDERTAELLIADEFEFSPISLEPTPPVSIDLIMSSDEEEQNVQSTT